MTYYYNNTSSTYTAKGNLNMITVAWTQDPTCDNTLIHISGNEQYGIIQAPCSTGYENIKFYLNKGLDVTIKYKPYIPEPKMTYIYSIETEDIVEGYLKVFPTVPYTSPMVFKPMQSLYLCTAWNANGVIISTKIYNSDTKPKYMLFGTDFIKIEPKQVLHNNMLNINNLFIVRENNDYKNIAYRDLTLSEKSALIPAKVKFGQFTYTETQQLDWIKADSFIYKGTITCNVNGKDICFWDDQGREFKYTLEYLKTLLNSLRDGKISGEFTYCTKGGRHLNYFPMPYTKITSTSTSTSNTTSNSLTLCTSDDSGDED